MTASLYQSRVERSTVSPRSRSRPRLCARLRFRAVFIAPELPGRHEPPDGVGVVLRVEPDALDLPVPGEAVAADQILGLDRRLVGQAELPERHLEVGALAVVRVEVDREEDEVLPVRRHLAVVEDVVVPGVVEA